MCAERKTEQAENRVAGGSSERTFQKTLERERTVERDVAERKAVERD